MNHHHHHPLMFLRNPIVHLNSMDHDGSDLPQEEKLTTPPKVDVTTADGASSGGTRRSKSIPLPPSHVRRTQSELQLCEDMETAERRDLNMFYRLVNGIRERQMNLVKEHHQESSQSSFCNEQGAHHAATHIMETETCLAHIIHTRNSPIMDRTGNIHHDRSSIHSFPIDGNGNVVPNEATAALDALNQGPLADPLFHQHGDEEGLQASGWWSLTGFDDVDREVNAAGVAMTALSVAPSICVHQQPLPLTPPYQRQTVAANTSATSITGTSNIPRSPSGAEDWIFDLDL